VANIIIRKIINILYLIMPKDGVSIYVSEPFFNNPLIFRGLQSKYLIVLRRLYTYTAKYISPIFLIVCKYPITYIGS